MKFTIIICLAILTQGCFLSKSAVKGNLKGLTSTEKKGSKRTEKEPATTQPATTQPVVTATVEKKVEKKGRTAREAKFHLDYHADYLTSHFPLEDRILNLDSCKKDLEKARKGLQEITVHTTIKAYKRLESEIAIRDKRMPEWEGKLKSYETGLKEDQIIERLFGAYNPYSMRTISIYNTIKRDIADKKPALKLDLVKANDVDLMIKLYDQALKLEQDQELIAVCKRGGFINTEKQKERGAMLCDTARNWRTYFNALFESTIQQSVTGEVKFIKALGDDLKNGHYNSMVPKYLKNPDRIIAENYKRLKPLYEKLNKELPKNLYSSSYEEIKNLRKTWKKAIKTYRWEKKWRYQDQSVSRALKVALRSEFKAKFYRVGLEDRSWNIKKNGLGIPLDRTKSGQVMAKVKGESYCRLYTFDASGEYAGHGRYTKTEVIFDDGYQITRCK